MHPSHQQPAAQSEMTSHLAENTDKRYQPGVKLVNPTDFRDNNNVGAPDADTTMDPEHMSLAKQKAEKKATSTSLFGRFIEQAYSWLMFGRADQEDDNTKSPDDSDEATVDFFQVPADLKLGRHDCRSQNRLEDAEEAAIFRAYWAKRREKIQAARAKRNKADADKPGEELGNTDEKAYVDEEEIWDEELLQKVRGYYQDEDPRIREQCRIMMAGNKR